MILFGIHVIEAALAANYPLKILHFHVSKDRAARLAAIRRKAEDRGVQIFEHKDAKEFEGIWRRGGGKSEDLGSAQGVFALGKEFDYHELGELLDTFADRDTATLVILDSITDPQNLGAILRTSAFFGVAGLVTMDRRAAPVTPVTLKISSGGFCFVPVAQVGNLVQAIEKIREAGFWIYGLSEHAKLPLSKLRLDGKIALVIGNEESGLRPLVEKSCDELASLTAAHEFKSLNAATAAAVALATLQAQPK